MDYKGLLIFCAMLGYNYAQNADGSEVADIYPSMQIVAEGSRAVFTCVTSLEQASFVWGKPARELNEKRDDVIITQLAHNVSVLEIPRSHVKRHKRTYRCTVSTPQQTLTANDATLKVISASRLHRYHPFVNFIRQEDKFAFSSAGGGPVRISSEIQCMTTYDKDVEKTKRPLTWRWIRGGNEDIKFTEDFKTGRIEQTYPEGHLIINNPVEADYETTFTCVAANSWGTTYGQAFQLNKTEAPVPEPRTCRDRDGAEVQHGEMYMPHAHDPCLQCECFYGNQGRCISVACEAPTCELYEPSTEKCCDYTCIGDGTKVEPTGQCTAFSGEIVNEGDIYKPDADPCVTCVCRQGEPTTCASVSCIPPPMSCEHVRPVPGECCKFTCANDEEDLEENKPTALPIVEAPKKKVLGHVYVQQVGASKALVQWKLPASYDESMDKFTSFTVNMFHDLSNMADAQVIEVSDRNYVIVDDLDVNSVYYVMVNATSEMNKAVLMTRTENFSPKPRSSSALVLSDSLGQLFESRGAIYYTGYSLPRQFSPISKRHDLDIVLNLHSFHLAEVSTYNESPCPNQECGFLRFYTYDNDGEMVNHVSIMFVDDRDFLWAKAHL